MNHHREHVWIKNHRSKAHIDPNCWRCPDEAVKKPVSVYPNGLEYCRYCAESHRNWIKGISADGCERCGKNGVDGMCGECQTQVLLRR